MFLAEPEQRNQRFAELREALPAGLRYNTARAYWGGLEDIKAWAEQRGLDVMELTGQQFQQYLAALKQGGYSLSTIRRRGTSWRASGMSAGLCRRKCL